MLYTNNKSYYCCARQVNNNNNYKQTELFEPVTSKYVVDLSTRSNMYCSLPGLQKLLYYELE